MKCGCGHHHITCVECGCGHYDIMSVKCRCGHCDITCVKYGCVLHYKVNYIESGMKCHGDCLWLLVGADGRYVGANGRYVGADLSHPDESGRGVIKRSSPSSLYSAENATNHAPKLL